MPSPSQEARTQEPAVVDIVSDDFSKKEKIESQHVPSRDLCRNCELDSLGENQIFTSRRYRRTICELIP